MASAAATRSNRGPNHDEHSLKDAIDNEPVRWHEYRVPTPVTHSPNTIPEPAL